MSHSEARLNRALLDTLHPSGPRYKGAIEEFDHIAKTGHPHAQYLLAKELLQGAAKKSRPDQQRAEILLRHAATAGHIGALISLTHLQGKPPSTKLKVYQYAANQGHPVGLFNLGLMYIDGVHIEQDSLKGLEMCQRAAEFGDPDSCVNLARWCLLGDFIPRDDVQGLKFLRAAIQNGTPHGLNEKAYLYLSNCLLYGTGTQKNSAEAVKLLEDATTRGHAEAMFRLGLLYSTGGFGVTDHIKAKQWFERASANGSGAADYHLGLVHFRAKGAMRRLQKAKDCFHQALNRGYRRAANHLIVIYQTGIDGVIEQDTTYVKKLQAAKSDAEKKFTVINHNVAEISEQKGKLFEQLVDATRNGDPDATFYLSKIYATGTADDMVMRDEKQAISLMKRAALDGHADPLWHMVQHYRDEAEEAEAERCLEEAVRLEHTDALCSAAYHSIRKQDVARAITLYERAAEIGHGKALFNLGLIYHRGEGGIKPSKKFARRYFEAAATAGYARAAHNMGALTEHEMPHTVAEGWYERSRNGKEAEVSVLTNLNLGHLYEKRGDFDKAKQHFGRAANANHIEGMKWLANLLLKHQDATEVDAIAGREWEKRYQAAKKAEKTS